MSVAADEFKKLETQTRLFAHTRRGAIMLSMFGCVGVGWALHQPKQASTPTREQRTLDSLGFTAPIFRAHVDSTIRVETVYVARSVKAATVGSAALATAKHDSALADSLEKAAFLAHDTAAVTWEGVAAARMVEAEHAMQAAESLRVALTDMTEARVEADHRASLDSARVVAVTDALKRTADDLAKADPPCRVVWLHCPSRRFAAVTGVALGVTAVLVLPHVLKP